MTSDIFPHHHLSAGLDLMEIGRILGFTRVIGKKQGYFGLPLRDIVIQGDAAWPKTPAMETAWLPTPDELEALNAGAPIILRVYGTSHPPVLLYTGTIPDVIDSIRSASYQRWRGQ